MKKINKQGVIIIFALFNCLGLFSQNKTVTDSSKTSNDTLKQFLGRLVQSVDIKPRASQGIEFSFGVYPFGDSILVAQHKGKSHGAWEAEASEYVQINEKDPQTDLYVASSDGIGSRLFSKATATQRNDGAACLSPDGKELYFTQSYRVQKSLHFSIQVAVLENNTWVLKPERAFEHKTIQYAYPTISSDGKFMFFASNKNGNWDVFMLKRTGSQWADPQPLTYVNSPADELFPFLLNDSILIMSADRSDSYGGLDLYYSNIKTKSKPVNLKQPINTEFDDVSMTFLKNNDSVGYITSNRDQTIPKDQLYSFIIHWKQPEKPVCRDMIAMADSLIIPVSISFMIDQSLKPEAEKKLNDFAKYVKDTYRVPTKTTYTSGQKISRDIDPSQVMIDVSLSVPARGVDDVKHRLAEIMESMLKEENKLVQQKKETEKASDLYESVSKTAVAAVEKNIQKGAVAATPVAPVNEDDEVNMFFKSYQNNDDIQAIIEVIDPGAEQLGRPQRVESRKKVPLKKGSDYSVNVSVDKDNDMYIAGQNMKGKSSTLDVSKDRKSIVYTENKEFEDVYNKLFTVQVNALTRQVPLSYFGKLKPIKMYACMDGLFRYTYGRAANAQDAERLLSTVREAGFSDAFIISLRRIEKILQDVYAIQVEAATTQRTADYFKNLSNVMEYVGCSDNLYRYAVGRYTNMTDAMSELCRIKALGYPTAFITNVKRFDFKRPIE